MCQICLGREVCMMQKLRQFGAWLRSRLLRLVRVGAWRRKSQIVALVLLILVVASCVLAALKPSEQDMISQASEEMQQLIQADENNTRKRVTITYNSLFVINYVSFSTSGASAMSEQYLGFAGQVFDATVDADAGTGVRVASTVGKLVNYTYRMLGCGQSILYGVKLTIVLTLISVFTGLLLSVFLALGKISKHKWINRPCSAYIFFFRGTPLLIQLLCIYYAIPGILGFAWSDLFRNVAGTEAVYWGAFLAAYISFSLNSAAYCAEIVRAAILSIDKGQHEAAKALGMNYSQTMSQVIIPQSIGRLIPPIANEFIMVLKDASLVFAISLMDVTTISKSIMVAEGSFMVYFPALVIYLIITAIFSYIFNKLEARFSRYL